MSQRLISLNPDLKRLRDEGYDVEVHGSYVLLKSVPYVNSRKEIAYGILVSDLSLAGDRTTTPSTHVAYFAGDHPCNRDGFEIANIKHQSETKTLDADLVVHHSFSSKPSGGYQDHYDKLATYAAIISSPAQALDRRVTPRTYPVIEREDDETVFNYLDTASSRAEIAAVTRKLALKRMAIIGVGGTGSYILDLVAKTPVSEIHLFDGDVFSQHNAFRSPGAPSIEELRAKPAKVAHFKERYSLMHRGIVAHPYALDRVNVTELEDMDFAFLCLEAGDAKQAVLEKLEELAIPFIDVGRGVDHTDDSLGGILRVTTSTKEKRDHAKTRIPVQPSGDSAYTRNLQIADLNALNAALAVIKWKKLFGFYRDLEREHHSTYTVDGNCLDNDDILQ